MNDFILSEMYRLELRWSYVEYTHEGICNLHRSYFSGPALSDAIRLNDEDHIMLDFVKQYSIIVSNVYVAKLSWRGVVYNNDGSIAIYNANISNDSELNNVPKLNNTDYIVIDTSGHDVGNHPFNLLYKSYVVNEDSLLYDFRRV
jgi:hypothetical protein